MIEIEQSAVINALTKQVAELSLRLAERDAAITALQAEAEELRKQQLQEMNE